MSNPFDNLSFEEEINPQRWTEETRLHTPTFEALLKADGTLWLSGPALQEGFSVTDAQVLTRFLSERVHLPPVDPPYEEDPEDYSNYARSTFLERDQEQPEQKLNFELFPPRTVHHVSPTETINDILHTVEGVQHPLSEETQAALDEIVNEQRRRFKAKESETTEHDDE